MFKLIDELFTMVGYAIFTVIGLIGIVVAFTLYPTISLIALGLILLAIFSSSSTFLKFEKWLDKKLEEDIQKNSLTKFFSRPFKKSQ